MKTINKWHNQSTYTPPLSPACKMCAHGSKMVILITGLCTVNCYYCPLSISKKNTDRIFADEWELTSEQDIDILYQEAQLIDATGVGITGGDPLVVWQRTQTYIQHLKNYFGESFHIHLYTHGTTNTQYIPDLIHSGLDEIRFHPHPHFWIQMNKSPQKKPLQETLKQDVDVAIEIPALPHKEKDLIQLITWANNQGIHYVNLNELEFSETNQTNLINKGYTTKSELSAAVKHSQETAYHVLQHVQESTLDIGVHYCSVSFKDGVQLKNRILRRAHNTAQPYDIITQDGTIIKGIILPNQNTSLTKLSAYLKKTYHIKKHLITINTVQQRIELAPWILQTIAAQLTQHGHHCYLTEEYPTADKLEVERIPLPL